LFFESIEASRKLAQKYCDPPQQLVEGHPDSAQDGIELIALNPTEAVAVHSMLSFQVPNPRLDRRSPFHPPHNGGLSLRSLKYDA
jgi:hypothetical protein